MNRDVNNLRENVHKIYQKSNKEFRHEEIKSIRTEETKQDNQGFTKPLRNLKETFERYLEESRIGLNKIKFEELSMVKLNARCSAVLQNELSPREKDPGSFVLPCIISNTTVRNTLADLRASISVMPFSMFKHLGLGNPISVNMVIEMAVRSMQSQKGIVKNILVKIHKFIFLVDFVILDIIKDVKVPIILGRPMLATAHARIDVFGGKFSLEVGKEQIIFNANEGATPVTVSPSYSPIPLSPNRSPGNNWDLVREFQDSDNNMGIEIDDFVAIDDLWDDLDPGALTNEQPLKPEFLNVGNRVHRHNPYNLKITCKIGFVNFNPYIDTHSPFNVMSRVACNSVIKRELVYTRNNMVGMENNLHVFVGCHTFLTDFIILENINEFVEKGLTVVLFGKPFKENVGLEEDINKGILWFKIGDDRIIFNMPRVERRLNKLTTEQQNMMYPILKVSDEDKAKGIRGIRAFEQETRDLDVEIKQMKELKANYGVTSPQELRRNQVNEGMSQHPSYGINASSCLRYNQHHQGRMTYPSHRYSVTSTQGFDTYCSILDIITQA
ncbi:homeodomain-like protein [Tanacetum coccineum]|uniref:Homeodomain-like protein n=1 Tax=Tanacetum coccineum TaxID=301880 RepID=A0ABQ4ZLG0_9ASTR